MGAEQCHIHGVQVGHLCCDHVAAGIKGDAALSASSSVIAEIDMLDDGSELLEICICQPCAAQFNISPNARLPGAAFDNGIPYVAPTCCRCYTAWLESRSSQ
jgi:hypothetical protein